MLVTQLNTVTVKSKAFWCLLMFQCSILHDSVITRILKSSLHCFWCILWGQIWETPGSVFLHSFHCLNHYCWEFSLSDYFISLSSSRFHYQNFTIRKKTTIIVSLIKLKGISKIYPSKTLINFKTPQSLVCLYWVIMTQSSSPGWEKSVITHSTHC